MVKISYLVYYDNLLQNGTDIVIKCDKRLWQNVSDFSYKMRHYYYKMPQLLQNVSVLLQNPIVIINSDIYYKMRRYKKFYSFHGNSVC